MLASVVTMLIMRGILCFFSPVDSNSQSAWYTMLSSVDSTAHSAWYTMLSSVDSNAQHRWFTILSGVQSIKFICFHLINTYKRIYKIMIEIHRKCGYH